MSNRPVTSRRHARAPFARARGFTLIELALVIAIVALLLGALLTPLATQFQQRRIKQAEGVLADIRESLIGYALSNGRLPCPDTTAPPDGAEDAPCPGAPAVATGALPWVTLGVEPVDSWGRIFLYGVTPEFTFQVVTGSPPAVPNQLDLNDAGNITVNDRNANTKALIQLTGTAAAVVISLGANGYGGQDLDGNNYVAPAPGGGQTILDEPENTDTDSIFVKRGLSPGANNCNDGPPPPPAGVTYCEYDDLVVWIPDTLLRSRLVAAGQLP